MSGTGDGLENYYSGDKAWNCYVNGEYFVAEWKLCKFQKQLVKSVGGDLKLARVIFFHLRSNSLEWLESEIPALELITPLECLKTAWGLRRLKECLMRFPC